MLLHWLSSCVEMNKLLNLVALHLVSITCTKFRLDLHSDPEFDVTEMRESTGSIALYRCA